MALFRTLLVALLIFPAALRAQTTVYRPGQMPVFTFDELKTLSRPKPLSPALEKKLHQVLHGVIVDNTASRTAAPIASDKLGPVIRAADWNIERGENFDWVALALKDSSAFHDRLLKDNPTLDKTQLDQATEEAHLLSQSSILILNEVDLGMTRSGYRDVARDLAARLRMNYVYGPEFVEVDPLKLGTEELTAEDVGGDQQLRTDLERELKADPKLYKGLHGSAILSRYPISNVRLVRLPVCYDWFGKEVDSVSQIEAGKRVASDKIFLEKIEREIRRGGRIAIIADLAVKEVPGGKVTVVNAHLENKCPPACRVQQMRAIFDQIKDVRSPVVFAGDLNTTNSDASKLSLGYLAKSKATDYRFWAGQAVRMGTPLPSLFALNYLKNFNDPTARDIKVLANNREAALFSTTENFRFSDQGRFDFRGDPAFTINNTGKRLADSNQRDRKGFVYTFALPRDFKGFFGRFRLDWFFVKPLYDNGHLTGSLSPVFPRTMLSLNDAPKEHISDHAPITVELPLHSPWKKEETQATAEISSTQ
ncbi:MAG TPA: endonuclease/exonuclease/phosphatase family protein [Edaphobacter sp.]|nr:endonuclease/exonuclease/phosphatase family protein [Edaphobacter sp.]